ncbi:MAG: FkbM family methyltransferase [Herminiimonas sp.]|nr:FkbM family methyltransferase [Herminiimonas sp.]
MNDGTNFLDVTGYLDFFSSSRADGGKAADFMAANVNRKKYFIGKNVESLALLEHFSFDGVIDDFAAPGSCWNGVPCVPRATVPQGSMVINCSTSISPVSVARLAEAIGGSNALSYSQLCQLLYPRLPPPEFVCQARDDLTSNRAHYQALHARLEDDASRRVFNTLMRYRLTADVDTMVDFSVRIQEQYFEPFLGDLDDAVFVDCGGYDGDTTEQFCKRYPAYRKVFLFEPSQQNIASARVRLQDVRDVDFIPLGVSDAPGILFFNPDAGSASSVSADGTAQIAVTTIDAAVDATNCFIKMDLEGWELKALQGAQGHIANGHPILAIAVYHTISDFWRIPEYVLSLRPDYRIYLRHYTEGWSETVMYFIPTGPAPV